MFVEQDAKDDWFQNTKSHFYLEKVAAGMAAYLPEDAEDQLNDAAAQGEQIMDAREKLQEIELLKKDEDTSHASPSSGLQQETAPKGYNEEFRDDMDQLIDEKSRLLNQ